jgi:DNA-nicking Smr family endonuclease
VQDDDLFTSEMSGVEPLKRDPRERLVKTDRTDSAVRRQAAVTAPARSDNSLTDDGIPPLDAWYALEFKRPGIQNGVIPEIAARTL